MPVSTPAISPHMLNLMTTRFRRVIVEVGSEIRPLHKVIANVDPETIDSNPFLEKQYSSLGTMDAKPEGTQFKMDNIIEGGQVQVQSTPWGKGFEWTYEAMLFDLYKLYDQISADLIKAGKHRIEMEFWRLFNDAFDGNFFTGFDGLPLCHTAHPYLDPALGSQSNRSATDMSLSVAGLQEMELASNVLEDPRGLPDDSRRIRIIIHHPARIHTARVVLQSVYDPDSANNAINPVVDSGFKYFPVRYLTSQSAWFGITLPGLHSLSIRFAQNLLPGSYADPRNLSMFNTLYVNFAVWFTYWQGVWGSMGTGQ